MPALEEVFARFGFSFNNAQLEAGKAKVAGLSNKIDGATRGLQAVGAALGGSLVVHGLNGIAEQLDVFDSLRVQTKLSTQDIQALSLAAELNKSSTAEMANSLILLQKAMGQLGSTSAATSVQTQALTKLGIPLKNSQGDVKSLNELLPDIFANFSNLTTEVDKAFVANSLFGRSGVKLIPVLDQGADGLAKLRKQLEAVGGGASEDAIRKAGVYRDSLSKLHFSFFALKGVLATSIFPWLTRVTDAATAGVAKFAKWADQTTLFKTAAIGLAGTLAFTLGRALGPYLLPGLTFAGLFLAVDDFLAFLSGKGSVIGDILDKWFGPDAAKIVRAGVNRIIDDFKIIWEDLLAGGNRFSTRWGETWEKIKDDVVFRLEQVWAHIKKWATKALNPIEWLRIARGEGTSDEAFGIVKGGLTKGLGAVGTTQSAANLPSDEKAMGNRALYDLQHSLLPQIQAIASRAANNPGQATAKQAQANVRNLVNQYAPQISVAARASDDKELAQKIAQAIKLELDGQWRKAQQALTDKAGS